MKMLTALALTLSLFSAYADLDDIYEAMAGRNPFRKLGGTTYDLRPRFIWETNFTVRRFQNARPIPEFRRIVGTVLQVTPNGLLITGNERYSSTLIRDLIFLTNYPGESVALDDSHIACYAQEIGRYHYTSVTGAGRTIQLFDHGTIPDDAEIESIVQSTATAEQYRVQKLNEAVQSYKDAQRTKQAEADARLLAFQKQQATNGNATVQYELANRYLVGNGVPVDTNEAMRLLTESARLGYKPAVGKLKLLR